MEARLLLGIHSHASPFFDSLFLLSHELVRPVTCVLIVCGAMALHLWRGERRLALLWLVVGLTTGAIEYGLKPSVGRVRPELWPRPGFEQRGFSFPSGHAVASATFYPLMALLVARRRPSWRASAWLMGVAFALYIGFGRLYLGVHWPSDVLAGWTLGGLQVALAALWLRRADGQARSAG